MSGVIKEFLVLAGFLCLGSFVLGMLGGQSADQRSAADQAAAQDALNLELDQLQEDVDDLKTRAEATDARLLRAEQMIDKLVAVESIDPT